MASIVCKFFSGASVPAVVARGAPGAGEGALSAPAPAEPMGDMGTGELPMKVVDRRAGTGELSANERPPTVVDVEGSEGPAVLLTARLTVDPGSGNDALPDPVPVPDATTSPAPGGNVVLPCNDSSPPVLELDRIIDMLNRRFGFSPAAIPPFPLVPALPMVARMLL